MGMDGWMDGLWGSDGMIASGGEGGGWVEEQGQIFRAAQAWRE